MAKANHPKSPAPKANHPQANNLSRRQRPANPALAGDQAPAEASPATAVVDAETAELPPPICPYCKKPTKLGRKNAFFVFFECAEGCGYEYKQPRANLTEHLKRTRAKSEDYSAH